jgi:NAD(P)-dependent dehydrogenase (short-subunit alcohol dehydrogenase family)
MMAASGRVALVTGAGTRIGRASALALAEDGWSLVLAGLDLPALQETGDMTREFETATLVVECDIRDEDQVLALFDATEQRFGRLDLLFNNAGHFGTTDSLEDITLEKWRATVDTNLTGTFLCTRSAFALMKRQRPMGGRIINNGSLSAHVPRDNAVAYTATKHAITGLTKSASLAGRDYDIAVGQLDVGIAVANPDLESMTQMEVGDVSEALRFMANLPISSNVFSMILTPTKMRFIGRG